uniref:Translation initiation factor 3 n=1 Tax=Leachiella pacifica TaxID=282357 RepID=A0A3S8UVY0_9FLOR|nr:translation initiation factor 3 [Leachiella pacifica]
MIILNNSSILQSVKNDLNNCPKIRLIDQSGTQLGIYFSHDAINLALKQGLNIIILNKKVFPPICKIVNYEKYKFLQEKKIKRIKKKQQNTTLKEIKIRYKIDIHDYKVKLNKALGFLRSKNKVKLTIVFKGREIQHLSLGVKLLEKIAKELYFISLIQQLPIQDGKNITMILGPKKK